MAISFDLGQVARNALLSACAVAAARPQTVMRPTVRMSFHRRWWWLSLAVLCRASFILRCCFI